jgi:hypothetical protein
MNKRLALLDNFSTANDQAAFRCAEGKYQQVRKAARME